MLLLLMESSWGVAQHTFHHQHHQQQPLAAGTPLHSRGTAGAAGGAAADLAVGRLLWDGGARSLCENVTECFCFESGQDLEAVCIDPGMDTIPTGQLMLIMQSHRRYIMLLVLFFVPLFQTCRGI